MGVEPTADAYAAPATGFEDRGAHRDTTTPTSNPTRQRRSGQGEKREVRGEKRTSLNLPPTPRLTILQVAAGA